MDDSYKKGVCVTTTGFRRHPERNQDNAGIGSRKIATPQDLINYNHESNFG